MEKLLMALGFVQQGVQTAEDAGFNLNPIIGKVLAAGIPMVPVIAGLAAELFKSPQRQWTQEMMEERADFYIAEQAEIIKKFVKDSDGTEDNS